MEQRKLRKFVINKETISNLTNLERSRFVGGETADCTNGGFGCPYETEYLPNCPGGGGYPNLDSLICKSDCCGTGPCTSLPCGKSDTGGDSFPVLCDNSWVLC